MDQQLLYVFRHSPYGSARAREGLEALLAAAAFEQPVAALFMDDGVYQLLKDQQPMGKSQERMLSALPIYDVKHLYVHQQSLDLRALQRDELILDAQPLDNAQARALIAQARQVLSF